MMCKSESLAYSQTALSSVLKDLNILQIRLFLLFSLIGKALIPFILCDYRIQTSGHNHIHCNRQ